MVATSSGCSQAERSDYIVTKDKHLLDLNIYAGARIIKPHEFLSVQNNYCNFLTIVGDMIARQE
ncbi:MAG: hypothetical protein JO185_16905 [Acidobacteriaceae bacterium]|nr:hypothetical protein [Acidobacteriaceae bacterium]